MACIVCGHTMKNLGVDNQRIFYCWRCGAVKSVVGDHETTEVPALVNRVRAAADTAKPVCLDSVTGSQAIPDKLWRDVLEAAGIKPALRDFMGSIG